MTLPTQRPGKELSRRQFVSVAAAAAAGYLLTGCRPRPQHEVPPERLRDLLRQMERITPRIIIGTVLAVAGVVLVILGRNL